MLFFNSTFRSLSSTQFTVNVKCIEICWESEWMQDWKKWQNWMLKVTVKVHLSHIKYVIFVCSFSALAKNKNIYVTYLRYFPRTAKHGSYDVTLRWFWYIFCVYWIKYNTCVLAFTFVQSNLPSASHYYSLAKLCEQFLIFLTAVQSICTE